MSRRLDLQDLLEEILGTREVYFQPPENVKMEYPCIVYARTNIDPRYANNRVYKTKDQYTITVIDRNPDSKLPGTIAQLATARFTQAFVRDNLNHSVFTIHY